MEKQRIIRVTGKGNLKVHPNMTRITMTLNRTSREYGETLEESARCTEALKELLASFGFHHSDIKTLHFSVNPEMESYEENGTYKSRLTGYSFTHRMKVEFESDNDFLGKILYALANSPLHPEFRLSYTVKDKEAVKNQLLAKAVEDGRAKAEVLTAASGVQLGSLLSIDYSWGELELVQEPLGGILYETAPLARSYALDIEPDDIDAEDTVTMVWEIKMTPSDDNLW